MKFKNYRNSHTNEDTIYSRKNIADMSVREAFSRKDEIMAQHNSIGIPSEGELQSSPNAVWVEAYTRDDGTEVKAHWRSKPNSGRGVNNDMGLPTGGASEVTNVKEKKENSSDVKTENILNKQSNETIEQTEQTPEQKEQEKDKRLYPDEIAGVKRGKPMSFEEADGGKVNPNYYNTTYDENKDDYYNNCQCCVIAYEARRRGYDVEAGPYIEDGTTGELGKKTIFGAWIDPDTDEVCEIGTEIDVIGGQNCYDELENEVKQGERYALVDAHFVEQENEDKRVDAHVRVVERDNDGNLIMYDPQDGGIRKGDDMKEYINKWMGVDAQLNPQFLRIDNKAFNPYYLNHAVKSKR